MKRRLGEAESEEPFKSKRNRSNATNPLPLTRLLECLDSSTLTSIITNLVQRHPELEQEVSYLVPKPSLSATLATLDNLSKRMLSAFPYGGEPRGEYAYNRVGPHVEAFLSALSDYTPQFLPPIEQQPITSLNYLDSVTSMLHKLPDWTNPLHNYHKQTAYEEISKAWVLTIRESAKRGGGIGVIATGWVDKIQKHEAMSSGRLEGVLQAARQELGWLGDKQGRAMFSTPTTELKSWA